MCYNKTVSLIMFLFGNVGCAALALKSYFVEALFLSWVVSMQLVEFFLWTLQPCPNSTNLVVSRVGALINSLEPVVLYTAILCFSKKRLPKSVHYLVTVFCVATLLYNLEITSLECTTVTTVSSPHLHWRWNYFSFYDQYYLVFFTVVCVLISHGVEHWKECLAVNVASYSVSYYVYSETHMVGAMWCFSAAVCPWVLYTLYTFKERTNYLRSGLRLRKEEEL